MNLDEYYIKRTFELARKAEGRTSPNPMVGCIIVKKGKVIAEGFHKKAGLPHAEIEALNKINNRAKGADLYVNLEPCFHWGRTPPCVDRVIASGIRRVVVASKDPNPRVCGKSISRLKKSGIKVTSGVLSSEARELNEVFFTNIKSKRPFVVAKVAQTFDGKVADSKGKSKWITGTKARQYAKKLRSLCDAILVGANTVIKDNPSLSCPGKKLVKVVLDPRLRISSKAKLFEESKDVIIFTNKDVAKHKIEAFKDKASIVGLDCLRKGFNLKMVLKTLYAEGICSVFVEGGSRTLGSFFDHRLVDKLYMFLAPKIMGKYSSLDSIGGSGYLAIEKITQLKNIDIKQIGKDYLITAYPEFR
ncbi:MAG: bifunctional diaminohydroxyphosphoribosylaminopyrimidine deaminase/5-amino-6-(5-phosphoribosylamino)uracil reductase RibD [Candidatus Omnitrophica bacterium]|nr:bifunctional diaminohydroxyphosphoribosylaminopyrimidine deaminase/5-amino-6-(5-phosphoribosylamino)uracil reductase RibD [Candidatus Omnitrophota bacterium]